jgi:predicted enzyme related to lactoylglutathione lyase
MKAIIYLTLAVLLFAAGRVSSTQDAKSSATPPVAQIERVTGIGGVFLKVSDPKRLAAWYKDNLGIETKGGFHNFEWREKDKPDEVGKTIWTLFPTNTTYFGASKSPVMINYRVANLDRMLEQLRSAGVQPEKVVDYSYGRFSWITDPDGNRIELWEPKAAKPK